MAEMVGSAVIGETVHRIISSIADKHEDTATRRDNMERLEMAHIKMEAALETSNKWCVTDVSLLRWRKMLKRAAQECDDELYKCKRRALEDQQIEDGVRQSSFPKRIAHATKTFVSSFITRHNNDEPSTSVVRKFERYADGAGEFLRFIKFGSKSWKYIFFDPLIGHLLAGKFLWYEIMCGGQLNFFSALPMSFEGRGLEAVVLFGLEDSAVPDNNFLLGVRLRLSESTDVIGNVIKCLQSLTPQLKSTAEIAEQKLTQIPTQDFSHGLYVASSDKELWKFCNTLTQMYRPNPLCCKEYERMPCSGNTNTLKLSNIFPEPVIGVLFHSRISLFEYNRQRTPVEVERDFLKDLPPLKIGVVFMPHASPENLHPKAENSVIEAIDGEKLHNIHTNVSLHELEEMLLPKAIDCFYHKDEATTYEMFWKSKHGAAHLCVEKTSTQLTSTRKTNDKAKVLSGGYPRSDASSRSTSHIALVYRTYLSSKGRRLCLKYKSLLNLIPKRDEVV